MRSMSLLSLSPTNSQHPITYYHLVRCIRTYSFFFVQQKEHTQHFPAAGQVEHCPEELWSNARAVIRECLAAAGASAADVAALGITNQRETTIAWDR